MDSALSVVCLVQLKAISPYQADADGLSESWQDHPTPAADQTWDSGPEEGGGDGLQWRASLHSGRGPG